MKSWAQAKLVGLSDKTFRTKTNNLSIYILRKIQHSTTSTTIIYEQKKENLAKAVENNYHYAHNENINNEGN